MSSHGLGLWIVRLQDWKIVRLKNWKIRVAQFSNFHQSSNFQSSNIILHLWNGKTIGPRIPVCPTSIHIINCHIRHVMVPLHTSYDPSPTSTNLYA